MPVSSIVSFICWSAFHQHKRPGAMFGARSPAQRRSSTQTEAATNRRFSGRPSARPVRRARFHTKASTTLPIAPNPRRSCRRQARQSQVPAPCAPPLAIEVQGGNCEEKFAPPSQCARDLRNRADISGGGERVSSSVVGKRRRSLAFALI